MHKCPAAPCRFVFKERSPSNTLALSVLLGSKQNVIFLPSAVCDIGSASFKYDMRRLSEILAFPKAWYRRSIARRLFLGDQTINLPGELLHVVRTSIHLVGNVSQFLGCKYIYIKMSQLIYSLQGRCSG